MENPCAAFWLGVRALLPMHLGVMPFSVIYHRRIAKRHSAAARGSGLTSYPHFLADGCLEEVFTEFPQHEPGIYAMLPSNRHVPHRVRVLRRRCCGYAE